MMSDDDVDLMSRAFPVEDSREEFDLDIPPTSGQEYLRRVQLEAKKCPSIVVADIDTSPFKNKQTFKIYATTGLPAPTGYSPSIQWQRQQTAKFSAVRQKFRLNKTQVKKEMGRKKPDLPDRRDVQGWCTLCFGRLRTQNADLMSSLADNDDSESCSSETQTSGPWVGKNGENGSPPLLSIVANMDQPTVLKVLEYHINWFEATGFTPEQGQWFYALLTCLEKPLDPEACSLLRSLARNCANLRASLSGPREEQLAPLNLLICLVARYFDQSDMADKR